MSPSILGYLISGIQYFMRKFGNIYIYINILQKKAMLFGNKKILVLQNEKNYTKLKITVSFRSLYKPFCLGKMELGLLRTRKSCQLPIIELKIWPALTTSLIVLELTLGPFIRGKIRRVLNKTRTVPFIRACLI